MKNETTELERSETGIVPARGLSEKSVDALPLDAKKYKNHLADFDMTEEQKLELLEALWSIMAAFVDLGFGVDAVQYIFRDNGPNSLDSGGGEVEEMKPSSRFNRIALITRGKEDCS